MAKTIKTSRVCPNCGSSIEYAFQQEYEVPLLNKKIKQEIMDQRGDFFSTTCAKCGVNITFAFPFRYIDPVQKLDFYLMPIGHPSEQQFFDNIESYNTHKGFMTRLVADGDALAEKIIINEAKLDDRVVELCKALMWGDLCEQDSKFNGYDLQCALYAFSKGSEYRHTIIYGYDVNGERDTVALHLTDDYYKMIADAYKSIFLRNPLTVFAEVNEKWASKIFDIRRQDMRNEANV